VAPDNESLAFVLDANGRLLDRRFASGLDTQYAWNADGSLASISHTKAGSTLASNAYTYDGVGNRATNAETIGGTTLNEAYSYDELHRLVQFANGTAAQQQAYTYDPLNNRIQQAVGQTSPVISAYQFDAANELTAVHSGSLTGPVTATLTYDTNGNLQSDGTRSYTWDDLDELSQVSNGATTVAYAYDALGRRLQKTVNGTLTQFLNDGDTLYAQYGATWTYPTARYSAMGLDQPVVRGQVNADGSDGTAQYYLADGLGSVLAVADSADSNVTSQRFDPWGNVTAASGVIPQVGFTGREPDETGLVYYRARYYNPGLGRFVSRDPIGLQGGINNYAYVGNNPVNYADPSGNCGPFTPLCAWLAETAPEWGPPTLGALKTAGGFALGYGGAAATGTVSTAGRIAAGLVGAAGLGNSTKVVEIAKTLTGLNTYGSVAVASGTTASFAEGSAQLGDVLTGTGEFNLPKIPSMGLATAGV
jgi:RHS repeat-associated protein